MNKMKVIERKDADLSSHREEVEAVLEQLAKWKRERTLVGILLCFSRADGTGEFPAIVEQGLIQDLSSSGMTLITEDSSPRRIPMSDFQRWVVESTPHGPTITFDKPRRDTTAGAEKVSCSLTEAKRFLEYSGAGSLREAVEGIE